MTRITRVHEPKKSSLPRLLLCNPPSLYSAECQGTPGEKVAGKRGEGREGKAGEKHKVGFKNGPHFAKVALRVSWISGNWMTYTDRPPTPISTATIKKLPQQII